MKWCCCFFRYKQFESATEHENTVPWMSVVAAGARGHNNNLWSGGFPLDDLTVWRNRNVSDACSKMSGEEAESYWTRCFLGDWAMKNGDFPRHRQLEKIQAFCPTPSRLKRVSRLVKAPSRITNNSLPCHSPIGTADWMARLDHPNSEDTVCQKPDTVDCWAKLHPASLGWTNSQKSGFQGCLARLCCPGSGQNDHQTSNVVGSLATSHHQGFGQNDYQRSSCEDHPWLCLRWPQ